MDRSLPRISAQSPHRAHPGRRITWTPEVDARLTQLHASGASVRALARAFGLGRQAVSERATRLGIYTKPTLPQRKPTSVSSDDATRDPLPAGHPISWGLLTAGTSLDGAPYQLPENGIGQALAKAP